MGNVLDDTERQGIWALERMGWTALRIQQATAPAGDRQRLSQGRGYSGAGAWPSPRRDGKSGNFTGGGVHRPPPPVAVAAAVTRAASQRLRAVSRTHRGRARGRAHAMAIWQDLVDDVGFPARYASVRRFVRQLKATAPPGARVVIVTTPGEEGQVDYGDGPMVRDPQTGKHRRTRLFVLTLAHSRKAVRLLVWRSSAQTWDELHEPAFVGLAARPVPSSSTTSKKGADCVTCRAAPGQRGFTHDCHCDCFWDSQRSVHSAMIRHGV